MTRTWAARSVALGIGFAVAFAASTPGEARAERVGYAFEGTLVPPPVGSSQTYTLFGVTVPNTWPITGTFSYDTTAAGVVAFEDAKAFKQTIQGGFTWNILNAESHSPALRLAASEYVTTIANNYLPDGYSNSIDYISFDYNSKFVPPPPRVLVNGIPYSGSTAVLSAALSWDATVFNDPDEPKLHATLPLGGFSSYVGLARSGSPAAFAITSFSRITPLLGDINIDGQLDASDYVEWRKAFGGSTANFAYADANADGVVGAADYVLWRKAVSLAGAAIVPEPQAHLLVAVAALFLAGCKRERLTWDRFAQT